MKHSRYLKEVFGNFVIDRNDDAEALPETPMSIRSLETHEVKEQDATEVVDSVFRMSKLALQNSSKWFRLYLATANRRELHLSILRENTFMAVSMDDAEELRRIKSVTPEKLWAIWGYYLGCNGRATQRCRPDLLGVLPKLNGEEFPGYDEVAERWLALKARPNKDSPEDIRQKQRGEAIFRVVRTPFEKMKEIKLRDLEDELNSQDAGMWQGTNTPARGINYGSSAGDYGGWRPIHFVAGNPYAKKTCEPALRLMIGAKADCTLTDASGFSALHIAALSGNVGIVNVLLEFGCFVEAGDKFGMTAILCAARARQSAVLRKIVQWVILPEAAPAILDTEAERTATQWSNATGNTMHRKVQEGNYDQMKFLIERGDGKGDHLADVNYKDSMGRRAVHLAVSSTNLDADCCKLLRALVALRANLDVRDQSNGETALHVAARLGRGPVVRCLLRLKAHPGLTDKQGRTPLMLCTMQSCQICICGKPFPDDDPYCKKFGCTGRREARETPQYTGVLSNSAVNWLDIQKILRWSGVGPVPGDAPKAREVRGEAKQTVKALFDKGFLDALPPMKKSALGRRASQAEGEEDDEDAEDEDDGEESQASPKSAGGARPSVVSRQGTAGGSLRDGEERAKHITPMDAARLRADALIALAFDDHKIVEEGGKFNRGDRLQLFRHCFQRRKDAPDYAPLEPVRFRLELLWKAVIAPLVKMDMEKSLSQKHSQFLQYCLATLYGKRGEAVGSLVLSVVGTKAGTMPAWEHIEEILREQEDLDDRVYELSVTLFRGSKPRRQKWVGAAWKFGEYPREPEMVPWDAFEYVDEETADVINTCGGKPPASEEAFKNNPTGCFEKDFTFETIDSEEAPPSRVDMVQLWNRLIVDEACGQWAITEDAAFYRIRAVGQRLFCPLLIEALDAVRGEADAKEGADDHREMLHYIESQIVDLNKYLDKPRLAYKDEWKVVFQTAQRILSDDVGPNLRTMDITPPSVTDPDWCPGGPKAELGQAGCLPEDDVRFLRKRYSALAYVELVRSGGVQGSDDFNEVVIALAASIKTAPLVEAFWIATFALLVWSRARHLKTIFERALRRRLRGIRVLVRGPLHKSRPQVLKAAVDLAEVIGKELQTGKSGQGLPSPTSPAQQSMAASPAPPFLTPSRSQASLASPAKSPGFAASPTKSSSVGDLGPTPTKNKTYTWGQPMSLEDMIGSPYKHIKRTVMTPPGAALEARRSRPKTPPPPPPRNLPTGFTDVLRAEVICEDEETMMEALSALFASPEKPSSATQSNRAMSKESIGSAKETAAATPNPSNNKDAQFMVVKVESDFHLPHGRVFPRCCSIKLICRIGSSQIVRGEELQQLVEVELLFPWTRDSRWLAKAIGPDPKEIPPPEVPTGRKKKKRINYG